MAGRTTPSGGSLHHALNMMTGFTTRPLRLASLIGFVFTIFGVVIFLVVVVRNLVQATLSRASLSWHRS